MNGIFTWIFLGHWATKLDDERPICSNWRMHDLARDWEMDEDKNDDDDCEEEEAAAADKQMNGMVWHGKHWKYLRHMLTLSTLLFAMLCARFRERARKRAHNYSCIYLTGATTHKNKKWLNEWAADEDDNDNSSNNQTVWNMNFGIDHDDGKKQQHRYMIIAVSSFCVSCN